ncbi:hypothetical protein [Sphingomonas sp. R86521]|uniref:hypothetical protein n=1 Tax=Sphingomonas sp. R86521 TaxID=3093860 RepID=UPI0036D4369B
MTVRIAKQSNVAALFRSRLGAVSTETYLRNEELVNIVGSLIETHAASEVATLQERIMLEEALRPVEELRFAITNIALDEFAGSELWTLEMAAYMHRLGVPTLVYSPRIGRVASVFGSQGFVLTDDPAVVRKFAPNVLHIHHHAETRAARRMVGPECRTINMIHGLLPLPEWPGPEMDVYLAVSLHAKAKGALLGPPTWNDIMLVPNFFDPRRFGTRKARKRSGALIHSSRATTAYVEQMRALLKRHGLAVDQIGYGSAVKERPETVLPRYRVVFAVGRSAIEAIASGCRVILWDHGIVGPAITVTNFWHALAANFSVAGSVLPFVMPDDSTIDDWLAGQLAMPDDTEALRLLVQRYLTVDAIGARMVKIYTNRSDAPSASQ